MNADRVKVYEEGKKAGIPIWAWLLPLLLLLALLAYFFVHRNSEPAGAPVTQNPPTATSPPQLGEVHFATNDATLTSEDKTSLDQAAAYMSQNPNAHMRLEGFTDSTGPSKLNDDLSGRRTAAVASYLESKGVPASRLTGQGFGPEDPKASNSTSAGKADNRRVELFQQQ